MCVHKKATLILEAVYRIKESKTRAIRRDICPPLCLERFTLCTNLASFHCVCPFIIHRLYACSLQLSIESHGECYGLSVDYCSFLSGCQGYRNHACLSPSPPFWLLFTKRLPSASMLTVNKIYAYTEFFGTIRSVLFSVYFH